MEEKNHLIIRTTLDLSLNNGQLNKEISEKYKAFFQSNLLPILNKELDKFGTKDIIEIDKWEFDLGDILFEKNEQISVAIFQDLESRFRKDIQKKLKALKKEKLPSRNPVDIIKEFLTTGVSQGTHFLDEKWLDEFYKNLSSKEKKSFVNFVVKNRGNSEFLQRLILQFNPSDLDLLFAALSTQFEQGKISLLRAYEKNGKAAKLILKETLLEGFRRFWILSWSSGNLDDLETIRWNLVLDKDLIRDLKKATGHERNQEASKIISEKLEEVKVQKNSVKNDVISSNREVDFSALNKSEEKKELLSYFLRNGSLPIHSKEISLTELKFILLNASHSIIRSLRNKLPRSEAHMFWRLLAQFDLNELKKFVKILFYDKQKKIQELNDIVYSMQNLKLIETSRDSNEKELLLSIISLFGRKPEFNFELRKEFFNQLEKNTFTIHLSKKDIERIKTAPLKKAEQKVVKKLLALLKDDADLELNKQTEEATVNKVIVRDIDLAQPFILDFLRYYIQYGKFPWWGSDLNTIKSSVPHLKANSISLAVLELAKGFYRFNDKQAQKEFKRWIAHPKSLENILYRLDNELKTFILDKAFPVYRQVTFTKLISLAIEIGKLNSAKKLYEKDLLEELIFRISGSVINQEEIDLKNTFDMALRAVAQLFNSTLAELIQSLLSTKQQLLKIHHLNKADLKTILVEIQREDQIRRSLDEGVSERQDEIEVLIKDVVLDYDALQALMFQFLTTGVMETSISYARFQSFIESLSDSGASDQDKLAELLSNEKSAFFLKYLEQRNVSFSEIVTVPNEIKAVEKAGYKTDDIKPVDLVFAKITKRIAEKEELGISKDVWREIFKDIEAHSQLAYSEFILIAESSGLSEEDLVKTNEIVSKKQNAILKLISMVDQLTMKLVGNESLSANEIKALITEIEIHRKDLKLISKTVKKPFKDRADIKLSELQFLKDQLEGVNQFEYKDLVHLLNQQLSLSSAQRKKILETFSEGSSIVVSEFVKRVKKSKHLNEAQLAALESELENEIQSLKAQVEEVNQFEYKDLVHLLNQQLSLSSAQRKKILATFSEGSSVQVEDLVKQLKKSKQLNEAQLAELVSVINNELSKKQLTPDIETDSSTEVAEEAKFLDFKDSANAVFAVIRHFILHRSLPWWSVYKDLQEVQQWLKRIHRTDPAGYNNELLKLIENRSIQKLLAEFVLVGGEIETIAEEPSDEQIQLFAEALKSVSIKNSEIGVEARNWFIQTMVELFKSNELSSTELRKALLMHLFKDQGFADDNVYEQLEKQFSQLETELSTESFEILDEVRQTIDKFNSKENIFTDVKSQIEEGLLWNQAWGDLHSLLDSWLASAKFIEANEESLLLMLLQKVTAHMAFAEGQTQENLVLKLIRKSENSPLLSNLMDLSDQLDHKDWLVVSQDEKLMHEMYVFISNHERLLSLNLITKDDLFVLHNLIEVVEQEVPSLYLLTMFLIQLKESKELSISGAIEFCEGMLEKTELKFETLKFNLNLLANSDWVKEAEIQTDYNKLFSKLLTRHDQNVSASAKEQLVEQAKVILEKDLAFFDFIQDQANTEDPGIYDVPEEEEIDQKWIQVKDGDRVFVANAGLVMLWPFLATLFKNLGYLEDKVFKNFESQERAIHLLQYIVDGEEGSPEFLLILNKVLCGIPPNQPIRRFVNLTTEEKEEAILFLTTVIGKWEQMKNTSVDVFRDTFLKRDGALMYKNEKWHLKVEYKPIDILLIKLPWGMSMIKYPWIKYLIFVEWNNKS